MLEKYIDFVASLFPSISPYAAEQAKKSVEQFYRSAKEFSCFSDTNNFPPLTQGDIIGKIKFRRYNNEGQEEEYITDGLIISNSCDIDHDDQILIAPFIPIDKLDIDKNNIRNNLYYSLLYFPDNRYWDKVADLKLLASYPAKIIARKIEQQQIERKHSLNLVGYYLLISKITVHLLRPEDSSVQLLRGTN